MQIFIDSADPNEIREAYSWGIIDGVTTNPTLAAKAGRPYREIVDDILSIIGPENTISLETVATDVDEMIAEGEKLAAMDSANERIVVKVPATLAGITATKRLSEKGIKVNVTLVFSPTQALLAAKAGAYFVSPFVDRLDDIDPGTGNLLVKDIRDIYDNFNFESQVLYASVRSVDKVADAALIGADIATVPFKILRELSSHPLTDKGVEMFLDDWKKSGLSL